MTHRLRKFALSAIVIIGFVGYAWRQRFGGDDAGAISPRPATTSSGVPSPTTENTNTNISLPGSSPTSNPTPSPSPTTGQYRDGSYTGSVTDAFYGNIQVRAKISGGRLTDVTFLQYPNDRQTSIFINSQAMPLLKQEAIEAQNANVSGVSGASATSQAFVESLQTALDQAHT